MGRTVRSTGGSLVAILGPSRGVVAGGPQGGGHGGWVSEQATPQWSRDRDLNGCWEKADSGTGPGGAV